MVPLDVLILVASGLVGGYIAGLVGVGGGIIFAPVLLFHYASIGRAGDAIVPLTIGTSLSCTLVASSASAYFQYRRGAVDASMALCVGLSSAVAVYMTTRFVTTQPWYDADAFQIVFGAVLILIAVHMLRERNESSHEPLAEVSLAPAAVFRWALAIGTPAGIIAAAVGVGGGLLLVPAYHHLRRFSLRRAVGTSSATVVVISLVGVATYAILGWGDTTVPSTAVGYVDVGRGLFLALPAVPAAQFGVWTAHTINSRALRYGFAAVALVIAIRLLLRALA